MKSKHRALTPLMDERSPGQAPKHGQAGQASPHPPAPLLDQPLQDLGLQAYNSLLMGPLLGLVIEARTMSVDERLDQARNSSDGTE